MTLYTSKRIYSFSELMLAVCVFYSIFSSSVEHSSTELFFSKKKHTHIHTQENAMKVSIMFNPEHGLGTIMVPENEEEVENKREREREKNPTVLKPEDATFLFPVSGNKEEILKMGRWEPESRYSSPILSKSTTNTPSWKFVSFCVEEPGNLRQRRLLEASTHENEWQIDHEKPKTFWKHLVINGVSLFLPPSIPHQDITLEYLDPPRPDGNNEKREMAICFPQHTPGITLIIGKIDRVFGIAWVLTLPEK